MSKTRKVTLIVAGTVIGVLGGLLILGEVATHTCIGQEAGGDPAWSPDGRRIAFQKQNELEVINVDGTGLRHVLKGSCPAGYSPAWSPDGRSLAIEQSGNDVGIDVLDLRNGRRTPVYEDRFPALAPSWSPDGRWIIFGTDGGDMVSVSSDGSGDDGGPYVGRGNGWSPDGKRMVFVDKGLQITRPKSGTPKPRKIFDHGESPAWSPDGRHIAFADGGEIDLIRPDGSALRPAYKCGRCRVSDPDWSPDGRRLVFYEKGVGIRVVTLASGNVRTLAKV